MGDHRLLSIARPVYRLPSPEIDALIGDLLDTMQANDGAGLAAVQIGVPLRVVVFGVANNPRYPTAATVPPTSLINPVITPLGDEFEEAWEGCLSIPGMRGLVPRHAMIHYTGFNPEGRLIDRTVTGFHARVVQHECDHLDGVLYPRRIDDLRQFGFIDALPLAQATQTE
jgi:peptide deformylase